MMRGVLLALVAALFGAVPAQAEWLEARTKHFILYSDSGGKMLRRQAIALERLDWGLRHFMHVDDAPQVESQKLTVFMVPDADIRRLCRCNDVAGFYLSRVSGSIAFSAKGGWTEGDSAAAFGRTVLFHEYAHHFLFGSYELAFPGWYGEGFAEFASTMKIGEESAQIGGAANHRAYGLLEGQKLSAAQMLDPDLRARLKGPQIDAFYGRGWLMTHYLTFNTDRYAQFKKYVAALNTGTPAIKAAEEAFGDLKVLDHELDRYLRAGRIPAMTMMYGSAPAADVAIRALGAGESALIGLRMESARGVDDAEAEKLYARAAPLAARYPDDAIAQGWVAEMAFDAGKDDAAEAAAGRAIARDPKSVQGLLYRARVKLRRLENAKSHDPAAWADARRGVVAANRADTDDAEPLWWYWNSFAMEGRAPSKSAFTGLYRAQELAPQDEGVRFAAATARIEQGDLAEAKRLLRPLAYDPHATAGNPAARMLAALDTGKKGPDVLAAAADIVVEVK